MFGVTGSGDLVAMTDVRIGSLDLPEHSGIQASRALATALFNELQSSTVVRVTSTSVLDADVSTVQVLLSAHLLALTQDKQVQIVPPVSPVIQEVLQSAGFVADPSPAIQALWTHEGTGE